MRQALLVLLEEVPLESITGVMVAERAAVGYATFFRHYADVRALLRDTVVALADELAARMIPALLAADPRGAATILVEEVAERRVAFRALFVGAGDALRGMLTRHVAAQVDGLPKLSPAWLPDRLAVRFAVASTVEVLDWWLQEEPGRGPAEVATLIDRLVLRIVSAEIEGSGGPAMRDPAPDQRKAGA